jgi:bacterioferritin-associated ferredoxin
LTIRSTAVVVSRCVCKATPFEELRARATANGWDLSDLMRETGAGAQCGLCRPYLRRRLRTGQTEFHKLLPLESLPRAERGDL